MVMTKVTDRNGNYRFDGVQIGDYLVQPVAANGWKFTTAATATINVTRGQKFDRVNFGLAGKSSTPHDRTNPTYGWSGGGGSVNLPRHRWEDLFA